MLMAWGLSHHFVFKWLVNLETWSQMTFPSLNPHSYNSKWDKHFMLIHLITFFPFHGKPKEFKSGVMTQGNWIWHKSIINKLVPKKKLFLGYFK